MNNIFNEIIKEVPVQDFGVEGLDVRIIPIATGTLFFISVDRDIDFPAHKHSEQRSIIVNGRCKLTIDGKTTVYKQGDTYCIPTSAPHTVKMFAGYAEIAFVQDSFDSERML